MSTTPSHGVQAGLIAYYSLKFGGAMVRAFAPTLSLKLKPFARPFVVAFVIAAAIFGMLPDLIGIYGHAHAALDAREQGAAQWLSARDWSAPHGYYWRAHNSDLYGRFSIVPFYSLHVWVDKFFHKKGGGWSAEAYAFEVVIDVCLLFLIWFAWKRARRVLLKREIATKTQSH